MVVKKRVLHYYFIIQFCKSDTSSSISVTHMCEDSASAVEFTIQEGASFVLELKSKLYCPGGLLRFTLRFGSLSK